MTILFICLLFGSTAFAASVTPENSNTDCSGNNADFDCIPTECKELCGCEGYYRYDEIKHECVLDLENLKLKTTITNNYITGDHDMVNDDGYAKKIREMNEKVFRGLIASAIFFIACACICVLSVCIFCCKVHYSDRKLKNEVKALREKLERVKGKKVVTDKNKRKSQDPIAESCNVVVADTDIMCV